MVEQKVLEDFVQGLKPEQKDTNTVHTAIVSNIDDEGVVWVNINGSDKETPTELVATEVKRGDAVTVQWRNNKLYVASNYTNPSAGVVRVSAVEAAAQTAQSAANNAVADAGRAKEAAEDAIATAESVHSIAQQAAEDAAEAKTSAGEAKTQATAATSYANGALTGLSTVQDVIGVLDWAQKNAQYSLTGDTDIVPGKTYWIRSGSGTEADPYTYAPVVSPVKTQLSNYYEISGVDEAMADYINTHLALTDEGLYVLGDDNGWKVRIASDGMYIVDDNGKTVAKYKDEITIGLDDGSQSYMKLDYHSMQMIDKEGNPYFYVSDLRDRAGNLIEEFNGDGSTATFKTAYEIVSAVKVEVDDVETTDYTVDSLHRTNFTLTNAPADGSIVRITYQTSEENSVKAYTLGTREGATGLFSYAMGANVEASGVCSFAEGVGTKARKGYSHAEGYATQAEQYAHAEGESTVAATWGHPEGNHTSAGVSAHAEGTNAKAHGQASHAQNYYTLASSNYQTAIGKYNEEDTADKYALIVGNGTNNNRSNAATVDWQGNVKTAGSVTENNGTRDIDLQISETTIQKYVNLGMSLT